jgi:hypothetical protein
MGEKLPWQIRIAQRGYGWYLAMKIGKALAAAPMFLLWLPLYAALGAVLWLAECVIEACKTTASVYGEAASYWRKRWFTGFSRSYYYSLDFYRPTPNEAGGEN